MRPPLEMGHGGPPITDPGPQGPHWGGQSLIMQLLTACGAAGVEVWTSAALTDLVVEEGRVVGVLVERSGEALTVPAAKGVLLAAGGFDHNNEMRTTYSHPVVAHDG